MGQTVYIENNSLIESFKEMERLLGILEPGVYRGFDTISYEGNNITFNHSQTGIERTLVSGVAKSERTGVVMTKQGTIIAFDNSETLSVDFNVTNDNARTDYLIGNHMYQDSPGGVDMALSILKGPVTSTDEPTIDDPLLDILIGKLTIPANATDHSGTTFERLDRPDLAGQGIPDRSIEGIKLILQAVDTAEIADNAITNDKVANDAIDTDQVVDEAITSIKIAEEGVQNLNIEDRAVTTSKIAIGGVSTVNIGNEQVTNAHLSTDAVTAMKVANSAITFIKLAPDVSEVLPTENQKAALAGTNGTAGVANKYVTDSDPRLGAASTPTGNAGGALDGTYPNPALVNNGVTFEKIQNVTGPTIIGRISTDQGLVSSLNPSETRQLIGMGGPYPIGSIRLRIGATGAEWRFEGSDSRTGLITGAIQGYTGSEINSRGSAIVFHSHPTTRYIVLDQMTYTETQLAASDDPLPALQQAVAVVIANKTTNQFLVCWDEINGGAQTTPCFLELVMFAY